jgi:hypothetical protein
LKSLAEVWRKFGGSWRRLYMQAIEIIGRRLAEVGGGWRRRKSLYRGGNFRPHLYTLMGVD